MRASPPHLTSGLRLVVLLGLAAAVTVFLGREREAKSEPFRIAGTLHDVGMNDVASVLIASPGGHVVLDGGYPGTAPMIMSSSSSSTAVRCGESCTFAPKPARSFPRSERSD